MAYNGKRAHKPGTFHARNDLVFVTFSGREFGRYILGGRWRYFERIKGNNASNINRDQQVENADLIKIIDRKIAVRQIAKMRMSQHD